MPLTLAIDYDQTFDRMPEIWSRFIADARSAGHRVFIVSSRRCECTPDGMCENHRDIAAVVIASGIILTSGSAKKWFLEQRGIKVDIWVDDCPESILQGK